MQSGFPCLSALLVLVISLHSLDCVVALDIGSKRSVPMSSSLEAFGGLKGLRIDLSDTGGTPGLDACMQAPTEEELLLQRLLQEDVDEAQRRVALAHYPEHWPGSDWLAPDAWAQMPEYIPAPWPQMSPERFWPNYNQSMNPNYDNQYMKPQEDYNQGMNPQEANELGFGEALDKTWGLQYCPKAAAPKHMPVQKSTPPLPQPLPPTPSPSLLWLNKGKVLKWWLSFADRVIAASQQETRNNLVEAFEDISDHEKKSKWRPIIEKICGNHLSRSTLVPSRIAKSESSHPTMSSGKSNVSLLKISDGCAVVHHI